MTGKAELHDARAPLARTQPSEVEVSQLLQKALQQHEECVRVADLADIAEPGEANNRPRYAWDNPIGLVVTERHDAGLG